MEIFDFIAEHINDDVHDLRLKVKKESLDFDIDYALMQIKCRQKTKKKIPGFLSSPGFLFPSLLSSEQATDESVAAFHSTLIPYGASVLDMTSGLGIDVMSLAGKASSVIAIDLDEIKTEHLMHNAEVLGIDNIECVNADSIDWLSDCDKRFDVIFIDPARRGDNGRRLYSLSDCQPNVVASLDIILKKCDKLIVKTSPLLDISLLSKELKGTTDIYVVCAHGECKEVLAVVAAGGHLEKIHAVDITDSGVRNCISFSPEELGNDCPILDKTVEIGSGYIYEPNAALMKMACGNKLCSVFHGLKKLAPSTNLYHSEQLYHDFPGRIFSIVEIPDKKRLKSMKGERLNVIARNYVMKPEELSKKYGLNSGDDDFIIGTKVARKSIPCLILCQRVKE